MKLYILVCVNLFVDQCIKTQEYEEEMSCVPYYSVVGSSTHAMVCTRLEIVHAVGVLSRYVSKIGNEHWTIVNIISRYMCGSISDGLCYEGIPGLDMVLDIYEFVYVY